MVDYTDVINEISSLLFKTDEEPDCSSKVHQLDHELYKLLQAVGLQVVSMLLAWLKDAHLTKKAKNNGLILHRRKLVNTSHCLARLKLVTTCEIKTQKKRRVRSKSNWVLNTRGSSVAHNLGL